MSTKYQYLPWVRQGAATAIRINEVKNQLSNNHPSRATIPISLRVNDWENDRVNLNLSLYGPGDVAGIDERIVIRTDPPPRSTGFETNYFPAIEFEHADFPWLFTPRVADGDGVLRPWICLVVIPRQAGVSIRQDTRRPLPTLTIQAPADPGLELPDLVESWAWAHAQVLSGGGGSTIDQLLSENSDRVISRLVSPRRLEANQSYLACLVPAYEAGRKAGLGMDLTDEDLLSLQPAWGSGAAAPSRLDLPVYYQWSFSTGEAGDFESLAGLLRGRPLPPGIGGRPLLVEGLGFGLPDQAGLIFEGALRAPGDGGDQPVPDQTFRDALRSLLNLVGEVPPADQDPLVGPPIYGGKYVGARQVPDEGEAPIWLRELNLFPQHRAAAGLGTLVIQEQQEALMAAAWEQLGDAERIKRALRRVPFATTILAAFVKKRLEPMTAEQVLQFTRPLHTRVLMSPVTLARQIRDSALPETVTTASYRKMTRPRGPLSRRIVKPGAGPAPFNAIIGRLAVKPVVRPIAFRPRPPGTVTLENTGRRASDLRTALAVTEAAGGDTTELRPLIDAVEGVQQYLTGAPPSPPLPGRPTLPLAQIKGTLLQRLDPALTVSARIKASIVRTDKVPVADPVGESIGREDFSGIPEFRQPMYAALRDISQEMLVPGVDEVPQNTVTLMATNDAFVEAYMAGLNQEMSRELIWREFPHDENQTYFRDFWDTSGSGGGDVATATRLDPIHTWDPAKGLGEQDGGTIQDDRLVLLVRGQLLQRFPDTIIYAVKAVNQRTLGDEEKYPLFRGTLDPDITFLGFDLTESQARGEGGDPGWFFILQEQPTAPRFGLDIDRDTTVPLGNWANLSWADMQLSAGGYIQVQASNQGGDLTVGPLPAYQWGFNAAHMAAITRQAPVRIAIHTRTILPPEDNG
jgi:hypothetical protein